MTKNIIIAVLAVALLGLGFVSLSGGQVVLSGTGPTHYQNESFLQGLCAGTLKQFCITNAGVVSSSANLALSGAVTLSGETTLDNCGSATWNPPAVSSTTVATTTISVPNSTFGDSYIVSFTATTTDASGAQIVKEVEGLTSTGSTTVQFSYPSLGGNGSINAATGTLKVCYFN